MQGKIVIAGGSGFLGKSIINRFVKIGFQVVVLSRKPEKTIDAVKYVNWDARTLGLWTNELEGALAVINFTGRSVNCRYTEKNKSEIVRSRVESTLILGKAIQLCTVPPRVWLNASSTAYYGYSEEVLKTEESFAGAGFSAAVCQEWEQAFSKYETSETRKVVLRMGVVLQSGFGLIIPFTRLVKLGLGGKIGSGEQYFSWIHEVDYVNIILWILEHSHINGVINAVSPNPVRNKDFMKALRAALNIPFGLPNYSPLVNLGAIFIGTEAELVLKGRRVVSKILEQEKFVFQYPHIEEAVKNLLIDQKK